MKIKRKNDSVERFDSSRRKLVTDFLRYSACFTILSNMPNLAGCSNTPSRAVDLAQKGKSQTLPTSVDPKIVSMAKGGDPYKLTRKAVDALGGMKKFVLPKERVMLMPNIAWDRSPEQAANTHPEVVRAVIDMCKEAGAREVGVFCHTCHPAQSTYKKSGIEDTSNKAGARVWYVSPGRDFVDVEVNGSILKKTRVFKEILSSDRFINIPIAKVHSLSGLTMCMKNLMGAVENRPILHTNIHENLPDLLTVIPVTLNILDATRILVKNGPTGGNLADVRSPEIVYAGTNLVSVDAFGCSLFEKEPSSIRYLKNAKNKGLGELSTDLLELREA